MRWVNAEAPLWCIMVTIASVSSLQVNVDLLIAPLIEEMRAVLAATPNGQLPLNSFKTGLNNSLVPMTFMFGCEEGYGIAPHILRRMGNTLDIASENHTILNMKVRCGEAFFRFPTCIAESSAKLFPTLNVSLEGVMQSSDFDITVNLHHRPECDVTVGAVTLVDMSGISFNFLESKLPKALSDLISSFLAKYHRKLLDESVLRAVEESIARLTEKIDLCEIFHPNLRPNDEL